MPLKIKQWTGSSWLTLDLTANASVYPPGVSNGAIGYIGDSLAYQGGSGVAAITSALTGAGWTDVRVSGLDSRMIWDATDTAGGTPAVINGWDSDNFTPADLVVSLGMNDMLWKSSTTWSASVDSLKSAISTQLPSVQRLWWINIAMSPGYNPGGADGGGVGDQGNTAGQFNSFLNSKLSGTGNVILDWNGYVKTNVTNNSNWDPGDVHMTPTGYAARNAWIASQLPGA